MSLRFIPLSCPAEIIFVVLKKYFRYRERRKNLRDCNRSRRFVVITVIVVTAAVVVDHRELINLIYTVNRKNTKMFFDIQSTKPDRF